MLFANDSVPDVWVCVPAIMPLMPVWAPAMFAPEMVIVAPPAPVACDRVMLFPPAKTIWLLNVPVVPEVLPPVDIPAENAGAPMLIVLPADAMLTRPVPEMDDVAGTLAADRDSANPDVFSVTDPLTLAPVKPVEVPAILPAACVCTV